MYLAAISALSQIFNLTLFAQHPKRDRGQVLRLKKQLLNAVLED
jgi:hypothetical protein